MKGYVRIILVAALLLLSTALLASLTISPMWPSGNTWKVPNKTGPTIITKESGNMLFLSKDGALYELQMSGALKSYGQVTGITNIVAPATYAKLGTNNYILYVTAQGTAQNKLVAHKVADSPAFVSTNLSSFAYGLTAQASDSNLYIYTATMDGTACQVQFSGTTFSASKTVNVSGQVKIPPVLSKDGNFLYVMTQNGKLYKIATSTFTSADLEIQLGGEFTVPMAMDENGYLYALNSSGVLYKINAGTEVHVSTGLTSTDSAGVLIDGDGYIYVFGGGKVFVFSSNSTSLLNMTPGGYSTGQQITTTPAIVKGRDGVTYVIVPSSANGYSGKITILAFNPTVGTLTVEKEWNIPGSFPISAAVGVAPVGALNDDYYFATATNDGTVYAWRFDARGPYGIWASYGQNSNHTGFIDASASLFKTRIRLVAKEGFNGYSLGSNYMGTTNYGLLYDATVLNADGTTDSSKTNLRTNETDPSKIPQGIPGSQRLEVNFPTPTVSTLLFGDNFRNNVMKGINPPSTDSEFKFRMWETSGSEGYEGSEGHNPATLTYRFNDRTVNLFTDASYTFYIYHKFPLDSPAAESTQTKIAFFDYNRYKPNPTAATNTITASTTYLNQEWYAFKWYVYQWNPEAPNGLYEYHTYNDRDSISLRIKGPAYIEIYYAQLSSTITLLLPDFAYGKTRAYLFLDAATNSVAYTIEATTLQGITIDNVESAVFDSSVGAHDWKSTYTSNHLKYVRDSIGTPLAKTTRVATLTLNLSFPQGVDFSGLNNESFDRYFDMYGYAQIRTQQVEPEDLRAKKVYRTNKFLHVVGDFNGDFVVDMNDWNLFVNKYNPNVPVTGADLIYNIGPRDHFNGPYPNYNSYKAGVLTDTTNIVDDKDLNYFAVMFGFVVPESYRVQ